MKYKIIFEVESDTKLFQEDIEVNDIYICIKLNDDECTKLKFEIQQIECEEINDNNEIIDEIKSY